MTLPSIWTCVGVDRLERVVLGLQADAAVLAEEALDRRLVGGLVVAGERDDDLAVAARPAARRTTTKSPSRMPASIIESPLTRRRNSSPPRASGSGTARYSSTFCSASSGPPAAISPTSGSRWTSAACAAARLRVAAQLERARLGRVALDQPGALEVREVRVHGRRRGEPDRLADLAHRRRVAVRVHVVGQELPDLLLSCRSASRTPRGRWRERTYVRQPE